MGSLLEKQLLAKTQICISEKGYQKYINLNEYIGSQGTSHGRECVSG